MIPVATLDPILNYSIDGKQGYVDFPITYLADYFFNTTDYPSVVSGGEDWFGREQLRKYLKAPLQASSFEEVPLVYAPLVADDLVSDLRGPGFRRISKEFDIRPWREIEREYERFLVVPQPVRDLQLLYHIRYITPKGFEEAQCNALLRCLQSGRAILLLQMPWEGGYWSYGGFESIQIFLQNNGIDPESVVLLFGQSKPVENYLREWCNIRVKTFNCFEAFPFEFNQEDTNLRVFSSFRKQCLDQVGLPKSYKFFSHIGNAYADRVTLYSILNRVFKKLSRVNMSNTYNNDLNFCYSDALTRIDNNREKYVSRVGAGIVDIVEEALKQDSSNLPECRIVSIDGTMYTCHNVLTDSYRKNSHIELYAETINHDYCDHPDCATDMLHFFTEKTFKPLASMKPFFVLGNRGSLAYLHQIGYQTFDAWWDESYDLEEDMMLRILLIVKELQKISLLSEDEMCRMEKEMEPVLVHNFDLRINRILEGQKNFENCLKEIYNG